MHKNLNFTLIILLAGILLYGCITTNTAYNRIPPGIWRGVIELEHFYIPVHRKDTIILLTDQFKEGELPFNFEVKYVDADRFYIEVINGSQRIRCDSIVYGRDRMAARDTFNWYFPGCKNYLHTEVRGGVMQGEWVLPGDANERMRFYAYSGRDYRFTSLSLKPQRDLTGNWAALFGIENTVQVQAIGALSQQNNHLEGSFKTAKDNYANLEGTIQGRKFWMSSFDGLHAYLLSGSIHGDSLQGEIRSGKQYRTLFTSWKNPHPELNVPDTLNRQPNK
jgi:hypothetical protein